MDWFLLTLLSVFVVSIANILQRVLMKDDKSNPYSYGVVFHLLLGVLNLIFAVLHGGFQIPSLSGNLAVLFLAAALWGGATIFLFKALQLAEASEVTILSSVRVVITILAAMIFLQESFSVQKVFGTIIILASILLVTNLKKGIRFNKGVIYTLGMALFSGLAIVADGFVVKSYDPVSYTTIVNFLIGFGLLVAYPKTLLEWSHFVQPKFLMKMLPLGIFSTIQGIAYLLALANGGNASQVGTIRQATVIVTVILAVILLNEKDNLARKLVAAVLVTIGVILLG